MFRLIVLFVVIFSASSLGDSALPLGHVRVAVAEDVVRPTHTPKICHGFYPTRDASAAWKRVGERMCPNNSAVLGSERRANIDHFAPPEHVAVLPVCCELPSDDILQGEVIRVLDSCPENSIAIGGEPHCDDGPDQRRCERSMYCRAINTERYQLGAKTIGAFWGVSINSWHEKYRLMRSNIPAAFRYVLGRRGRYQWNSEGCVGAPPGAVLVEKSNKRCHGLRYRRLEWAGLPGDPPKGTPMEIFPECDDIDSEFKESPLCVKR